MAWAIAEDVTVVTGRSATDADLAMAQSVIEGFVRRVSPDDDAGMRARDLRWLRNAVCWQAVWLASNPGAEARGLVSSILQDGVQAQLPTMDAVVLAPLAKRCIRNLSFRRRNHVRMVSDFEDGFGRFAFDLNSDTDSDGDDLLWTPMGDQGQLEAGRY